MKKPLHILLMDDDSDDHTVFEEVLSVIDQSIYCYHAFSAIDGLKKLEATHLFTDYIFLDLNMPIMDGWECLIEIQKRYTIPIVIYTTSSREIDIQEAERLGAQWFLVKSNSYENLIQCVELILKGSDVPTANCSKKMGVYKFHTRM